jgi:sulfite reductase alpha subunit-like flavoprotein
MREQGKELWSWLESDARFYVCGDVSFPPRHKEMHALLQD